jgi:hypothetical protein
MRAQQKIVIFSNRSNIELKFEDNWELRISIEYFKRLPMILMSQVFFNVIKFVKLTLNLFMLYNRELGKIIF